VVVVTDFRLCEKLRYVGVQTSTCRPPGADASPAPLSAGLVASLTVPASLPPEPDPLSPLAEPPLEPLAEPLLELPVDPPPDPLAEPPLDPLAEPLLDPLAEPLLELPVDSPLDPLDPLFEPELDAPSPLPPPQPAASTNAAKATDGDRARGDRRTPTRTEERIARIFIILIIALSPPALKRSSSPKSLGARVHAERVTVMWKVAAPCRSARRRPIQSDARISTLMRNAGCGDVRLPRSQSMRGGLCASRVGGTTESGAHRFTLTHWSAGGDVDLHRGRVDTGVLTDCA
jgi:hypothetical protein